jgi:hypothetical protein
MPPWFPARWLGMARYAQVLLPKRHPVVFPDRCPVCGKAAPGHAAKLGALLGPLRPLSNDVLARWQPTLPVCREHERRIRIARISDQLAWAGLSLASLGALLYLADRFEMFAAGWWSWAGVFVLGLLVPRALMAVLARPLFDVRPDDEFVEFALRNPGYAKDLAELNRS